VTGGPRRRRVLADPAFRTRAANPYNARLYTAVQEAGWQVEEFSWVAMLRRQDVVHLHWPELTFLTSHRPAQNAARLAVFFGLLRLARLRGTRLFWTAHNIGSHEQRSTAALRRRLRRLWGRNVDGVLTLSADAIDAVRAEYPEFRDVPVTVTPHGHYRADYDFSVDRAEARRRLGIPESRTVVVHAGQIRPYKNVPALAAAVVEQADPKLLLLVAGKPDRPETATAVEQAVTAARTARPSAGPAPAPGSGELQAIDPVVWTRFAPLSESEMALYLRAADLVVLPYLAIQNSGSAILALSAGRPVVVPRIGAMGELAELVGSEWVHTYRGDFDAATLRGALDWWADTPRAAEPDLGALDWPRIAADTIAAWEASIAAPRPKR
jgi:beta-1,4-mannosyltransferase